MRTKSCKKETCIRLALRICLYLRTHIGVEAPVNSYLSYFLPSEIASYYTLFEYRVRYLQDKKLRNIESINSYDDLRIKNFK